MVGAAQHMVSSRPLFRSAFGGATQRRLKQNVRCNELVMPDYVTEYFEKYAADTRARMNEHYKSEIVEFARLVTALISSLQRFSAETPEFDKNRPQHFAFGLMSKGTNSLAAAFELTLSGYMWEPPTLLRVALETFSVGWDIVHNTDRFQSWSKDKKFDSTRSISNAKEISEVIGNLNGLLSKMNVHINPTNSSPAMFLEDSPKIQLFGLIVPGKEGVRRNEIYLALFVTFICLRLGELSFYQYAESLETIEILPGGSEAKTRVSETHKQFVSEMTSIFQKMADGDMQW
jgi:hypothetical protein